MKMLTVEREATESEKSGGAVGEMTSSDRRVAGVTILPVEQSRAGVSRIGEGVRPRALGTEKSSSSGVEEAGVAAQ